uniref:Protein kinase domain-containing protein n=1 Tax=Panagrolaimus sp. ES5 TaxID=591445 RepID=A0AC34FG12_9BILA
MLPAQHSWHDSKVLIDFDNNFVRGISQYGSLLFVSLRDEIIFGKYSDAKGTFALSQTGSIKLEGYLIGDNRLLEFKVINESAVLACNTYGCSVCYNDNKESSCSPLKLPYLDDVSLKRQFIQIAASLVDDKIFIRSVYATNGSSIDVFEPSGRYQYERVKTTEDLTRLMSEQTVVAAFSTSTHTYFVGSAKRADLALKGSNDGTDFDSTRKNIEIRVSRICNNDHTNLLDSRIDLVLSCDNVDYQDIDTAVENHATAASYLPDTQKLLVAMRNGKKNTTICEYNFKEIQERFDETWNHCQATVSGKETEHECINYDYRDLPNKCFIFTWRKNEKYPYCEAFNDLPKLQSLRNCFLHESNSTHKRFGLLENFLPYNGKPIYKGSKQTIVALRESNDPRLLFVVNQDNRMQRLELDPSKFDNSLMWRPARAGAHMLEFIKSKDQVLFVDPRTDNTINYVHISCQELYQTCHNISWDDPLNCGFCVNPDGTGVVMPKNKLLCSTGNIVENVCPPVVEYFQNHNGEIIIEGREFKKLQNVYVKICEQQCIINAQQDSYIRCKIGQVKERGCNLTLIGALNQYPAFALRKSYDSEGVAPTTQDTGSKGGWTDSKVLRYVGFVVAASLLLAIIIGSYCAIKRKVPDKMKQDRGKHLSEISTPIERYNVVPGQIPLDDIREGTIRISQLTMIRKVGSGNSADVHLGHFVYDVSRPTDFIEVAVKTAKPNAREPMQEDDIKKEIEIMQSCKHQNIVKFIGWTRELGSMYIVTEFMSGGSVQDYLKDGRNRPTIGQCFSYVSQIVEGMAYLSHIHIIHRDLATRNCLLNSTHEIVKISDFGLSRKSDMNYEYVAIHNPRLPYRWLPIEALHDKVFSTKGDVWSFAVVVWELFQRGAIPYEGLDITGVREFLDSGMRLHRPEYCPEELYALMLSCWDENPDKRPTFEVLKVNVIDILFQYTEANPQQVQSEYERPTSSAHSAGPSSSRRQTSISGNSATTAV